MAKAGRGIRVRPRVRVADLLTIAETAERLRVSARTVEREIAAGRLACVRIRSRRLVDPADLAAYIAASREQTWQSGSAGTDTRSEYASVVVAALSGLLLRLHRRARRQCEQQQNDETHGDDDSPESLITHFCPALASNSVLSALPRVEPK